jgi:hypothetical protein
MRKILLLAALLSASFHSHADQVNVGLPCSFWAGLNETAVSGQATAGAPTLQLSKILFVRGVYEGAITAYGKLAVPDARSAREVALQQFGNTFYINTSYENLVTGLDSFCSDHQNQEIFLTEALQIVAMQLRGDTKDSIDREIDAVRKAASSP